MRIRFGDSPALRTSLTALVVCLGCYLGARADTWLRFPGAGAGMVFPSYAILTAALLASPPRSWWVLVLGATVGDVVAHWQGGATIAWAFTAELANHLRALLAAVGVRHFVRSRHPFDSMGETVVYLVVAVFLAPCVGACAGAGLAVAHGASHGFWAVWQQWMLSNAITALTLLPLLIVRLPARGAASGISARRLAEASLLLVGVLVVWLALFTLAHDGAQLRVARLYWSLPFLLWAAVRFGPRGISLALFGVAALSVGGAMRQLGPFAAESPTEGLLELHLFLIAVSVPLLLLSALLRQQRQTAAALWESQRQYRSVVEDQTEMICRFLHDGTYTFVNGAYCQTFGRSAGELIGGSIWSLVPDGVHRTRRELLEAITPASPLATRETHVSTRDGQTRWLQWRDRGFFDNRGVVVKYQSVGRDITDRKQAEDERRQLEAQRSVEAALREADRHKDEFLAMLGHELRNPLTPIVVSLEILRRHQSPNREAAWAVEAIGRQVQHLKRLVEDLLDISRLTLGKIQLQLAPADLTSVVNGAVEASRALIDSFGHKLTLLVPDGPVYLRADAARLTQVVANLLNNAAKYTEPGGHIQVSLQREGDCVRLSVQDDGIGMPGEALGSVFELFTQMPEARERAQGGLGIGLTLVKRLVESHGGTVEAFSAGMEQGSEIVVTLPLPSEVTGVGDQAGPSAADFGQASLDESFPTSLPTSVRASLPTSLRILAVDDNVDLAQALADILGMWGHTVQTAHDGLAALDLVKTFAPEVILLDLDLPKLGGLEAARRLRERPERPSTLMVSMSGFGVEQTRRRSRDAGFDHHLVKPIDVDALRTLIEGHARSAESATPRDRTPRLRTPAI